MSSTLPQPLLPSVPFLCPTRKKIWRPDRKSLPRKSDLFWKGGRSRCSFTAAGVQVADAGSTLQRNSFPSHDVHSGSALPLCSLLIRSRMGFSDFVTNSVGTAIYL